MSAFRTWTTPSLVEMISAVFSTASRYMATTSLVGPAARTTASDSQMLLLQVASTEARSWETYMSVVPDRTISPIRLQALLLKVGVPHGQSLVDQKHVRFEIGGDGEAQAHGHTTGEELDLAVDGIGKAGKLDDLVELLSDAAGAPCPGPPRRGTRSPDRSDRDGVRRSH